MKSEARSAAVYRDFEKLYKLAALYQGNTKQLEPHVMNVDAMLQKTLNDSETSETVIQFDFLMSAVFSDGTEIFKPSAPELTMAYALFCEGVRSIITVKGLKGQEILEWCLLIRKTLDPSKKQEVDLASILWRNRFSHLRIQVFNALLNLEEIGLRENSKELDAFRVEEESVDEILQREQLQTGPIRKFSVGPSSLQMSRGLTEMQAIRDEWWSLPSAQRFAHTSIGLEEKDVDRLRNQLADASYSERAKNLVRFSMEEVSALRSELEAYDANHIEFNLLSQTLSIFESSTLPSPHLQAYGLKVLENTLKSVIDRFHAGLILFLIRRLGPLKSRSDLKDFVANLVRMVREALQKDESRRLLLESLETPEGRKTGFELLGFVSKEEWPILIDILIAEKRTTGLEGFLRFLQKSNQKIDEALLAFGVQRLVHLIPLLRSIDWEGRQAFILRCLRSNQAQVADAAIDFLSDIELPPDQAFALFQKLSTASKIKFLQIISERNTEVWKPFARLFLRSHSWKIYPDEISVPLLRFVILSLHDEALSALSPFIESRRWGFFPLYPVERNLVLSVLANLRSPQLRTKLTPILSREAGVFFQSRKLKERLRSAL